MLTPAPTGSAPSSALTTPGWRSPLALLMLLGLANTLCFQTWMTLLNNFTYNEAGFTGREIGILQTVREIPGFLAFTAVFVLLMMREQTLAYLSILLLALGAALTGFFPTAVGLYVTTLIFSVGFHYFDTMGQSLSLQWLAKDTAAHGLGRVISAESFGALTAFGLIYLGYSVLGLGYPAVYFIAAVAATGIVLFAMASFPYFPQSVDQHRHLVLRRRYWLYYLITLFEGARRQIFVVFAGFMMVERFGFSVTAITTLFLINHLFNMTIAPTIGKLVMRFGERTALTLEYIGLFGVFFTYAFVTDPWLAAALYVIDHAFFAMSMASKTYFQKIAAPADIAPTAAVAFSINHIAAIVLPVTLGMVWTVSPEAVFLTGAGFALVSLGLARLIPRNPAPGHEVVWQKAPMLTPAQ